MISHSDKVTDIILSAVRRDQLIPVARSHVRLQNIESTRAR
jgi:hypothetical protein